MGGKITIICVGKIKEAYLRDAIAEYEKRLSKYVSLEIIEVDDEKTVENASAKEDNKVREREGERILSKIPDSSHVIGLVISGKEYTSVELSEHLSDLSVNGISHLTFIIGGSIGLSEEVLAECDERISFSRLTFPHQLMRVILLEQIYRCFRIVRGEPYHK